VTYPVCFYFTVAMSTQWYAWAGPNGVQARLCSPCWNYWRKYSGFKIANKSCTCNLGAILNSVKSCNDKIEIVNNFSGL